MMVDPPEYFDRIRRKSAERWKQLECDPELAAPWRLLFNQVQRPRHVLSELLQNADDARATQATVSIEEGIFIFEHNGEDFTEDDFSSICRFAYSNKRALHTIGFRGIGFRSIFSIGDQVEIRTATLAVRFESARFTEPHWLGNPLDSPRRTSIRVKIKDEGLREQIQESLAEWLNNSIPLLFFKNIREIQSGDRQMHWFPVRAGPVDGSKRLALDKEEAREVILIRSQEETFPDEALDEIKEERMVAEDEKTEFPSCRVELVVGAKGRLFVVLPTGVRTSLPFACNAPFIQDPARESIKDPERSPTNRWLLRHIGRLAATTMLSWLRNSDLPDEERALAYRLLPDVSEEDSSLEGVCAKIVKEAFFDMIDGQDILLTDQGTLVPAQGSVAIPHAVIDVWSAEQVTEYLDVMKRPALSRHIEAKGREKLEGYQLVDTVDILAVLGKKSMPKPGWRQLMDLWAFIAEKTNTGFRHGRSRAGLSNLHIVPAQGKDVLCLAKDVVRLAEDKLLQSAQDWNFLSQYLIALNPNWTRFLAERRREAESEADSRKVEAAYFILNGLGLHETSDVNKIVERVAGIFFAEPAGREIGNCIRFAQIAAKLGATVGDSFRYVNRRGQLSPTSGGMLFDEDGSLEELLPKRLRESLLLHLDYFGEPVCCSHEEWIEWLKSSRSGLMNFIPPVSNLVTIGYYQEELNKELQKRGYSGSLNYELNYKYPCFLLEDWDFDGEYIRHWTAMEKEKPDIWALICKRIMAESPGYWQNSNYAEVFERSTIDTCKKLPIYGVSPSWLVRLREKACLPDTHGALHKPYSLLRSTSDTEPLMGIEPFVHGSLDRESTRQFLDVLGVGSKPRGLGQLIDRLRALSKSKVPHVEESEKWYRAIDKMIDSCPTDELQTVEQAFQSEKLILSAEGSWCSASNIFVVANEQDVPDVPLILPSVAGLRLWHKIGVPERPTVELALQWLKKLPSGETLPEREIQRVNGLLSRYHVRVWKECAHWINLEGQWVPTENIDYGLSLQSPIAWEHLHSSVKQKTADLRYVGNDVLVDPPFSNVPALSMRVRDRVHELVPNGEPEERNWLATFGGELGRVEFDSEEETSRVRAAAGRLQNTLWQETEKLTILPCIDGKPVGTRRSANVHWSKEMLYYEKSCSKARLARDIAAEVGNALNRADIREALIYSFGRSSEDVREYLSENFQLASIESIEPEKEDEGDYRGNGISPVPTLEDPGGGHNGDNGVMRPPTDEEERQGTSQSDGELPESPSDNSGKKAPTRIEKPKESKPSLMERFAVNHGFSRNDSRFIGKDGSQIEKTGGSSFPWSRFSATGELVRSYKPVECCLERESMELDADVWDLLKDKPAIYSLVLKNTEGVPVEVTGDEIQTLYDEGKIKLFPATYRIKYTNDNARR